MSLDAAKLETVTPKHDSPSAARKVRSGRSAGSGSTIGGTHSNGQLSVEGADDSPRPTKLSRRDSVVTRDTRSRPTPPGTKKKADTKRVSTPRSTSPRKRRRVDSSPEAETRPTLHPARWTLRGTVEEAETSKVKKAPQRTAPASSKPISLQLQPMKLTNGHSHFSPDFALPPASPLSSLSGLNDSPAVDDDDVAIGDVVAHKMGTMDDRQDRQEPEIDVRINGTSQEQMDDMKYEDADTPLTVLTVNGRHSVPSDDTIVASEDVVTAVGKAPLSPQSGEVDRQNGQAAEDTPNPGLTYPQDTKAVAEKNADGEGDADAEGDDDAEGEVDEDV